MSPATFPQANIRFGPPPDLDGSQCGTIPAHVCEIQGGNLDGSQAVVVAWLPDPDDLARLQAGHPIYLTMLGGLAPHLLATTFDQAVRI